MEWQAYVKYVESQFTAASQAFDPEKVKVGDVIEIPWVKSYQHGAYIQITKVNKKSWHGVERKGSYGCGREWVISKDYPGLRMDRSVHLKLPEEMGVNKH